MEKLNNANCGTTNLNAISSSENYPADELPALLIFL